MGNPLGNLKKHRERKLFMHLVERHQMEWGKETYTGKPTLEQIMAARVVAFWWPTDLDMSLTITIHKSLKEIETYLVQLIWHVKERLPLVRLYQVYENKQLVKIKSVKIEFEK